MGTNYYTDEPTPCPTCGYCKDEPLHIGKSSIGWAFHFMSYPDLGLTSWRSWKAYLKNRVIKDEYGRTIDLADFESRVEAKQGDWTHLTAPDSAWGPYGRDGYFLDQQGYEFSKREFS